MIKLRLMHTGRLTAIALLCVALAATWNSPAMAKDKPPEIDSDGLHLLKNTKVRVAYAKPGISLDKYTKVKILDCFVQFKDNWEHDYNLQEVGLQGRVTDKDAEAIKTRLADEFKKVFTKELNEKGHEVVDDVGPDVLLLRPAIVNLDVTAPDLMKAGMTTTFVASAGEMTLYMELYDSATSELIARVIDPQGAPQMGGTRASRVSNKAAADRILRRWADDLREHLGDVQQNTAAN